MASSTPFDGTNFLTGAPDQDQPHGNDYQEHQSTRKSMEFVNNKEHDTIANDPSAADGGGEHKIGSAKIYHGDYSTASAGDNLPSLRPDGVNALDASDAGRLAFDTDATFGGKYYRWSGSAWVVDPVTLDTDADLTGKSWFLDEDDMVSDDATKTASQQSVKKYIDDNTGSADFLPTSYIGAESSTLPNGMIIKTGFKAESSNPHTVTFATPFPNACVWANATARDTSAITEQNTNIDAAPTTTQLKININSSSDGAYWIAIGY